MRGLARLGLVVALGLGVLSCGGPALSGSIDQYFALDYTREEILRSRDAIQITYYRDTPQQIDVVIRLTVVTTGFDFKPGKSFDLTGEYAPGHPRAVITHAVGGEPARVLPAVKRGSLSLDSGGVPGQATSGSFDLSFGDGGDFGSGRTVHGNYSAKAKDGDVAP